MGLFHLVDSVKDIYFVEKLFSLKCLIKIIFYNVFKLFKPPSSVGIVPNSRFSSRHLKFWFKKIINSESNGKICFTEIVD